MLESRPSLLGSDTKAQFSAQLLIGERNISLRKKNHQKNVMYFILKIKHKNHGAIRFTIFALCLDEGLRESK